MKRFEVMKIGIRFIQKWKRPSPHSKAKLSPDDLRSMVESAGFKVEDIEVMGDKTKVLYLRGRKI